MTPEEKFGAASAAFQFRLFFCGLIIGAYGGAYIIVVIWIITRALKP